MYYSYYFYTKFKRVKDTIFGNKLTINCKGNLLSLAHPKVMGIVNVTPDSFYDGGQNNSIDRAIKICKKHLEEGATFLDIGGYSSRPGAQHITEQVELGRVIPVIRAIVQTFPTAIISIDTFRSKVAEEAIEAGACMINDISAGNLDPTMFSLIAQLNVPYVLMHMQNGPVTMQANPSYDNVVLEVGHFFSKKINALRVLGVNDILLDVGFGFGKTIDHNYQLLKELTHFKLFELPLLVGLSRKSMLYKSLDIDPKYALNATTAAHMIALQNGAKILRVHDVREAMEAIQVFELGVQKCLS